MQVFVKTQSSLTFAVVIKQYTTVKDLKRLIHEISRIPINDFSLKFGSKELADHLLLSFYGVKAGSVIRLLNSIKELKSHGSWSKSFDSFDYQSKSTKNPLKTEMEILKTEFIDAIKNTFSQSKLSEVNIEGQINSIENCNEKNTVILGTDEGNIIYYNYAQRETIRTLSKATEHGIIRMVASEKNTLAVGAIKGVYAYKEGEGKQIAHMQDPVTILQITKDGDSIYFKKDENRVEKYRTTQMTSNCSFNYEVPVKAIALYNDEQKLVIGGSNSEIKIFSTTNPSEVHVVPNSKQGTVTMLKMTSDDKHLIAVYKERFIKVYNLELETCHVFRHTHSSVITSIAMCSKNKILFSGSKDGSLIMYDLEKLAIIHYSDDFMDGGIRSLQVSSNGKMLLSSGNNKNLKFLDLETVEEPYQVPTAFDSINCLSNHSKYTHFIVGCKDGSIRLFDHVGGNLDRSITDIEAGQVQVVTVSQASSNLVAAAFEDLSIRVFNSTTGKLVSRFEAAHKDQITGLEFSTDAKALISSSMDESLKIWNLQSSTATPISVTTLLLSESKDSKPLISSSLEEAQKILNSKSSTSNPMYIDINSHTDPIGCIRMSSDGKYLVTASWGRCINVFEFSQIEGKDIKSVELKLVHAFTDAHDGLITSVAISSDNKYIVSAGSDMTINMFDLERRNFVSTMKNSHKGVPKWLNITEDDQYIISVDDMGGICFFSVAARKQVHFDAITSSSEIAAAILTHNCQQIIIASTDGKINIMKNVLIPGVIKTTFGSISADSNLGFCFLEHFISPTVTSKRRLELISQYPNLYIHPFEWNFLHIIAIFAPSIELIDACIKAKIPFKKDSHGYTPLHYLLHSPKRDVTAVNYLLARFGELIQTDIDLYSVISTLSNQLPEIVKYGSFQAANFLEQALMTPQTFAKNSLTCFGSLKTVKKKFLISDSTVFTPELKEDLVGPDGDQMLSVKMIGFTFNYSSSSNDMLNLLLFLNDLDNEEIYKASPICKLVDYLWYKNSLFFYIPTIIYSSVMIVLSVYCGMSFEDRPFGLEVAIMFLGGVSFLYEFSLLLSEITLYFKDKWNLADMTVNVLLIVSCISFWTTGNDSLASRSLLTATVFFGYIRWISYFRVIDQTRKLTGMIREVLLDMRSFLFVLIFLSIGFGFIFFQLRPTSTFGAELLNTYNLIYTNYDDGPEGPEIPYFVIFTVLVSVVLLNLLIAIMNETYNRVQEMKNYYDTKTRVILTIEAITAKRFILKIFSFIRNSFLWKKMSFCPKRLLRTGLAKLHPETGMLMLENEFAVKTGYLYYVEEIKHQEYENLMERSSQGGIGKNGEVDVQSLLQEEVDALKKNFEDTLAENNKDIRADIHRIEEKLNMLIKMMGKEKEYPKQATK